MVSVRKIWHQINNRVTQTINGKDIHFEFVDVVDKLPPIQKLSEADPDVILYFQTREERNKQIIELLKHQRINVESYVYTAILFLMIGFSIGSLVGA